MPKDYKFFLSDILDSIQKIRSYTHDLSLAAFTEDSKTFDAVVRNLEIIGEAVKQIPQDVRERQPEIAWKRIIRLRDLLIHHYFGIDTRIVWDVIQNKLQPLEEAVSALLK